MTFDPSKLKVGDEVAVDGGGAFSVSSISAVERITPSGQILLAAGTRFTPQGREIGSSGRYSRWLREPTDEVREEVRRADLVASLRSPLYRWEDLPTETLERIKAALEQ